MLCYVCHNFGNNRMMLRISIATTAVLTLFMLFPAPFLGQVQRSIKESFNGQPAHWLWAEEYHDEHLTRTYPPGEMRFIKRSSNYNWSFVGIRSQADKPWRAATTFMMYSATGVNGGGLIAVTPSYNYIFVIGGGGNYWVGRYRSEGNEWVTLNPLTADGGYNPPCPAVKPPPQTNTLSMAFDGSTYTFVVNGSEVLRLPLDDRLSSLRNQITHLGVVAAGVVDVAFQDFEATYVEPPLPIVPDAFVGARKTWLREFDMPGARYPVISPNGRQLYYTAKGIDDKEDVYVADAISDSTWSNGRSIGWPINNATYNNVISVSQDGNELFLYGKYTEQGAWGGEGFSISRRTATGWSVPTSVNIAPFNSTASTREECLTPDRSVMLLSRNIPDDTRGEKDLYVSFRQTDGSYGKPINLGPNVNSPSNEGMPFIAADGKTLYFGSSHESYGDDDIFVCKRLDDTWTNWSKRVNLGPTINTQGWDGYFTIHPSGRWAYMNSSDGYRSGIVRVDLPTDPVSRTLLPDPVLLVKGKVLNAKTGSPLSVNIQYLDLSTGQRIGTAISEPAQGAYSIVLIGGRSYGFNAELQGYFPISENLNLEELQQYGEVERNLYLVPIEQGSVIRLNNLFFDTDKWDLRKESVEELDRLVDMLTTYPRMVIEISGHTDDRGSEAHNRTLSENRARSVLTYLTSHGISADRLSAIGYGESKPLAKGTSDADRQQNRRVEFVVKSM